MDTTKGWNDMKAQKLIKLAALASCAAVLAALVSGCGNQEETPVSTYDKTLTLLWDSGTFLYDFDDIGNAISKAEKDIESGLSKDTPLIRSQIENTKLIKAWTDEREYNVKSVAWGWADSLTSKLNAAFLAKQGPDLIIGETQMPKYAADGNLVAFPDDLAAFVRENCSPAAYQDMEIDGKIYGLSLAPSITILVWNKDILKQTQSYGEGTSVYENGPKDWEEWEKVMLEVDALNSKQLYAGGVYCGSNYGGYLRVGALMNGAGGGYADASGAPKINTAENQLAFDFVRRTYSHTIAGTLNATQDSDYFTAFDRGNLAYKMDGIWAVHDAQNLNFDCGFSLVPGPKEGDVSNMLIGAGYLAVPNYTDKQDVVFDLLRRILEEDIQKNIAKGGLRSPMLKSVITSEEYKAEQPLLYEFANYTLDGSVKGLPSFQGNQIDLWASVGTAINAAVTTDTPIESILSAAQGSMTTAYNKQ